MTKVLKTFQPNSTSAKSLSVERCPLLHISLNAPNERAQKELRKNIYIEDACYCLQHRLNHSIILRFNGGKFFHVLSVFISLSSTDKKRSFKCIRPQFFKELKSSFEQLNFMQTKFSFYVNDRNLRTFYPISKLLFSFSSTGI